MYSCIASSCGRTAKPSTDALGRQVPPVGWTVLFVRVDGGGRRPLWLCPDCSLKQYAAEGKVLRMLRELRGVG